MAARTGYSGPQIALHWLVAVLVVTAWATGDGMGRAFRRLTEQNLDPVAEAGLHVWLGVAIFALTLLRLALRALRGAPEPVGHGLAKQAAIWGHRLLYLMLLAVPLGGAATWFLGFEATAELHELFGNLFIFIAGAHALIALVHHFLLRDGTLTRMLRPGG